MTDIKTTLHNRGATYGSFSEHARITQAFKIMLEEELTDKEKVLPDYQQEALDMVFHKLGRVVNGDHMYIDSWRDMVGYLQLIVDIMETTEGATDVSISKLKVHDGVLQPDLVSHITANIVTQPNVTSIVDNPVGINNFKF